MLDRMDLAQNFQTVRERIQRACARAGRDPAHVELLAVTKGHGPELVREAMELGQRLFGENKVQEAKLKIPRCPAQARWHMIGHLQTNKCRDAAQAFAMIESVDSLKVAEEINKACDRFAKSMPVLLEINTAGESSKFGFTPGGVLDALSTLNDLPRLELHGFMTMAPYSKTPERARPYFRALRELKERCESALGAPMPVLSMGMSGDFEVAIEEGATRVRVGSALFGPRQSSMRNVEEDAP